MANTKIKYGNVEWTEGEKTFKVFVKDFQSKALKGFVSVNIEVKGEFNSRYNLNLIEGKNGLFLTEPGKKVEEKDGWKTYTDFKVPTKFKDFILKNITY